MRVCMCVWLSLCGSRRACACSSVGVCVRVHMLVCARIRRSALGVVCVCSGIDICACLRAYPRVSLFFVYACESAYVCAPVCVCACLCVGVCACVCLCVSDRVYVVKRMELCVRGYCTCACM